MSDVRYNPVLHRTAQLTVAATLLLIFMGGLVTSHGAGMSVPDWPNSYGYNMFTFPVSKWVGGIFYEHTHRLMGTVVGMLAIVLTVIAWRAEIANFAARLLSLVTRGRLGHWHFDSRHTRAVRWLCLGVLIAVIFQGVLGGLRVVLVKLDLAIVHACVAQAFLCLAALTAVVTSRWWIQTAPAPQNGSNRLAALAAACAIAIYLQLVVGAMMRHYEAGLAIPDIPLTYGKILPPMTDREVELANYQRSLDATIPAGTAPVTLERVWLHFGHRIGAVVVSLLVIALIATALRREAAGALRRPAYALIILLVAQITLGIVTVLWRKPADVASLHVATGALTLMTTFVLLIRSIRLHPASRTVAPNHQIQGTFATA